MSTAKAGRTAALSAQTSVLCLWLDRTSRSQPYGKTSHRDVFWFRPAHPPCGARTFPPCRRHTVTRMRKEDGFPKGRECALKYAAGVRTRGERRYAIFERTVNDMPVAYRLAMERKTMGSPSFGFRFLFKGTFRSPSKGPCGTRKCPGGAFSHKAVADLLGQAMNGERGCDASRKKKTVPDRDGFHEPYGKIPRWGIFP